MPDTKETEQTATQTMQAGDSTLPPTTTNEPVTITPTEGIPVVGTPVESTPVDNAAAPQNNSLLKKIRRPRVLLMGAGLIVVVAVLVAGLMYMSSHKKAVKQAQVQKAVQTHAQALDQASKLEYTSDFKGEAAALQKYLATNPSQADANEASMKLATAYINAGDYDQAIVYYKKVQATKDSRYTSAVLNGLGIAYTMKKDNATAIQYYQQAVDLYKSQDKQYDASLYEKIIKNLQTEK